MDAEKRNRKPGYIVLIVLTLLLLIVTVVFNFLPARAEDLDIFNYPITNLSDKYSLLITPAGWTFSIWGFIYTAQFIWVIYAHTLICRSNRYGTGALYYDPPFLPPAFFVAYMMNLILNVTWIFAFDSEYLAASFVALAGIAISLHVCLFLSFKYLWDFEQELSRSEMWLNIILVQNGIGIYSTWASIATLLNFGIVLVYLADVSMDTGCYIVLTILLAVFLLWAAFDIFIATKRLRYYFIPYIVLIVALSGIVDKQWVSSDVSGVVIFVTVILAVTIAVLLLKIFATIYNSRRKPLLIEGKKAGTDERDFF